MKHKTFLIRLINLIIIITAILIVHTLFLIRGQQDQIAQLNAQLKEAQMNADAYKTAFEEVAGQTEEGAKEPESAGFKDGTYEGSAEGFGGDITVQVTITSGKIDTIEILDASGEDTEYLNSAVQIIDSIKEAQTPDVDTITGATLSSTGIKNAVIYALQKAV